jgi:membrane protease YdiL (CAAX protease family)
MKSKRLSAMGWGERFLVALLFIIIGSFLMIVFNPWGKGPLLGRMADYLAKIVTIFFLLAAALLARRSSRYNKYWHLLFALLIMAVVVSLDLVIGNYLVLYLKVGGNSPVSAALQKLNEFVLVAAIIIPFTLVSGDSMGSIYIQKGNLKLGLIIGLGTFFLAAAGSVPMAKLFNAQNLSVARIIPWIPWILIFVLSNAALEELWFRGLFMRKLDPFFGKFISNFLIAVVFTLLHGSVTYTLNNYFFLAILFPLALAWGYVMQKTDSIWGSILFHAGMDIPIVLGLFSGMS